MGLKTINRWPIFCGPVKSSKGSFTLPPWFAPVITPDKISTIQAKPEPLNPAIGSCNPSKAFLGLVVGFPFLSKATPRGIFSPSFAALLIFPLLITEIDVSKTNGALLPEGAAKQIGFVPNKVFFAPWGAIAGGAFVKHKATNPCWAARSP